MYVEGGSANTLLGCTRRAISLEPYKLNGCIVERAFDTFRLLTLQVLQVTQFP